MKIGMIVTFFTLLPLQAKHYSKVTAQCKADGTSCPPEARLPSMMVGSVLLPIGFFIFACTFARIETLLDRELI